MANFIGVVGQVASDIYIGAGVACGIVGETAQRVGNLALAMFNDVKNWLDTTAIFGKAADGVFSARKESGYSMPKDVGLFKEGLAHVKYAAAVTSLPGTAFSVAEKMNDLLVKEHGVSTQTWESINLIGLTSGLLSKVHDVAAPFFMTIKDVYNDFDLDLVSDYNMRNLAVGSLARGVGSAERVASYFCGDKLMGAKTADKNECIRGVLKTGDSMAAGLFAVSKVVGSGSSKFSAMTSLVGSGCRLGDWLVKTYGKTV